MPTGRFGKCVVDFGRSILLRVCWVTCWPVACFAAGQLLVCWCAGASCMRLLLGLGLGLGLLLLLLPCLLSLWLAFGLPPSLTSSGNSMYITITSPNNVS